jgi:hypothetical protein
MSAALETEFDRRHAEAVARGERFYVDPTTGLLVMTALAHLERGRCCGSGCRHCPWPATQTEPRDADARKA